VSDALQLLWRRADIKDHVIEQPEMLSWTESDRKAIQAQKLIRRIADARSIICEDCGDPHLAEVVQYPRRGGRFYYHCPEIGRVTVPADRLRRWEVAFDHVGGALRAVMSLGGDHLEIASARVWLLGRRRRGKVTTEVFLVRGIWWPDASDLLDSCQRLQQSPDPIVLIPRRFPTKAAWAGRMGSLHALAETGDIRDSALVIQEDVIDDLRRIRLSPGLQSAAASVTEDAKRPAKLVRSIGSPASVQTVLQYMNSRGLDHDGFAKKVRTSGRTVRKFLSEGTVLRRIFNDMAAYLKLSTDELLQGTSPRRTQ
jgi:hypothetical protein